jgi:hypothetical protein
MKASLKILSDSLRYCRTGLIEFNPRTFILSAILALLCIAGIVLSTDQTLRNFTDRAIGDAIINGVDPTVRIKTYILCSLGSIVLFFIFYFIISCLQGMNILRIPMPDKSACFIRFLERLALWKNSFHNYLGGVFSRTSDGAPSHAATIERKTIFILGQILTILLLLALKHPAKAFAKLPVISFIIYLMALTAAVFYSKALTIRRFPNIFKSLSDHRVLTAFFSLAISFLVFVNASMSGKIIFSYVFYLYHALIFISFIALYYGLNFAIKRFSNIQWRRIGAAIVLFGMPVILIPIMAPLSNEIQFTLSSKIIFTPAQLFNLSSLFLTITGLLLFCGYLIKNNLHLHAGKIITRWYFPILGVSMLLLSASPQFFTSGWLDPLHSGEGITPVQQFFSFNKLPFVDLWNAHGLSDLLIQLVYCLVNGYRGIEFLLWISPITVSLSFLLIYFLLIRLFNPLLVLLLIMTVPLISAIIFYPILWSILPALALNVIHTKPSFIRFLFFWGILIFACLWVTALSAALLPAALFIVIGYYRQRKETGILIKAGASLFIVAAVIASCYYLLSIRHDHSLADRMMLVREYFKCDPLIGSYKTIGGTKWRAVFEYIFFPLTGITYIVYFIFQACLRRKAVSIAAQMFTFLAAVSLILAVRSFARHSLVEIFDPQLFALLCLCVPAIFVTRIDKTTAGSFFCIFYALYLMLFASGPILFKNGELFSFHQWKNKGSRVIEIPQADYDKFKRFCDTTIASNQTFYEFCNSPVLFYLAGREVPGYFFLPTMFYGADPAQQWYLKRFYTMHREGSIPFVVFKQRSYWTGEIDKIPNEIRHYRICEFIYKNYRPVGLVGTYEIWGTNGFLSSKPFYESLGAISFETVTNGNKSKAVEFQLPEKREKERNDTTYLLIAYEAQIPQLASIPYKFTPTESSASAADAYLQLCNGKLESLIPLSNINSTAAPKTVTLTIPPQYNVTVKSASLIRTQVPMVPLETNYTQNFHFEKLPYIWGTYDSLKASEKTKVLSAATRQFLSNNLLQFSFDPHIDKSTGNYFHFQIKSADQGMVTCAYGKQTKGIFSFITVPSEKTEDYLVRISTQWAWMSEDIGSITVKASSNVKIERLVIRKGD